MSPPEPPSTLHFFVDEAGDPTLFDAKGRILVGQEGCSKTFILGKLDVAEPAALHAALEGLRAVLLADPYFKSVPSMQAERGKTARAFHAKAPARDACRPARIPPSSKDWCPGRQEDRLARRGQPTISQPRP